MGITNTHIFGLVLSLTVSTGAFADGYSEPPPNPFDPSREEITEIINRACVGIGSSSGASHSHSIGTEQRSVYEEIIRTVGARSETLAESYIRVHCFDQHMGIGLFAPGFVMRHRGYAPEAQDTFAQIFSEMLIHLEILYRIYSGYDRSSYEAQRAEMFQVTVATFQLVLNITNYSEAKNLVCMQTQRSQGLFGALYVEYCNQRSSM
jgi:hypothetical protein